MRDNLGNRLYKSKPGDWRYFNGIVLSYQPRWVPGLFLGATRAFQTYHTYLGDQLSSYLPVIIPVFKNKITDLTDEEGGNVNRRDQLASLFVRWLWLKGKGEIYFEYGREDHSADFRDLLSEPGHTRAYLFGLRKLYPLKKASGQFIQFNMEITQLEATKSRRLSRNFSWYTHAGIVHGYTHNGQLLGAGIGPGGNIQTINISWVKGLKVVGIQVERYTHNKDLWYLAEFNALQHWTDLITSLTGAWDYKNLVFTGSLDGILSLNYQWMNEPPGNDPGAIATATNEYSFQARLGILYRF